MKFMWKKTAAFMAAAALAVTAAGCMGGDKAAKEEPVEKEVTVYMGVVEQAAKVIAEEFEKDTGIKVKFVRMSGGETLSRIRAEKNNPQASVWYGGSADSYIMAKKEGLLEAYKSANAEKIKAEFKDPEGYWTGIYQGYLGFILDGRWFDEHKVAPPKSWDDLLKPEFTGQIVMGNPGSASTGYVVVSAIVQNRGEEKGLEYLAKLDKQIKQYTKAGAAPARSAALGEAAIGITYLHNGIRLMKSGDTNVRLSLPEEGTAYELGAVAIIKNAPQKGAAKKFVDWSLSKKAQELGQKNKSYQFLTNPEANPPKEAEAFKDAKLMKYDFLWSGENRARLLEAWNKAVKK
ncbi:MAG: ABC transporter substrate-binding protein [Acidaminococcaceae bacterium]|nr:ABC transporter substrate-binding protein [Acidaminococcaceae bacterium]